jgi:PEGA domain
MRNDIAGLAFVLASAAVTGAAPALAGPPASFIVVDRAASDRADELVKQSLALAKADKWTEAAPLMREAWALKRSYDIAGNLGIVEATLGQWRDAAEHLTYAFKTFPASGKPELKKLLEQWLGKVLPQVAVVTIRVDADKAEIFVDGRSVGTAPLAEAIFVEPGTRRIEARLAGYVTAGATVLATKGGTSEVGLAMKEEETTTPPQPPPKAEPRSVVPGAVLGGLAGVALATGIGLLVGGRGKASTAKAEHDAIVSAGHSCVMGAGNYDAGCAALYDTTSTGNTLQQAGVWMMGGAGAATLGAALYFAWPALKPTGPKSGALRFAPVVSPGAGGLVVTGVL